MFYRLGVLIVKELIQMIRAKALVLMVIFGPLAEMSLVAWSTSAPITNLPTVVVDESRSEASRDLLVAFHNTETFQFEHYLDDPSQATPYIESGEAVAALIIPANYSQRLTSPLDSSPELAFILDGSDPIAASEALRSAEGVVSAMNQKLAVQWNGGHDEALSLVEPRLRVRYNEEMKKSIYTVPSELGLILFAITVMIAAIGIARERELGTLEQLTVTPLRQLELIIAKSVPAVLMGFVAYLLMLAVAMLFFGIPMRGSWTLLLGVSFFFLLVELNIGLMISAYAKNQMQALLLAFTWVMIEFFFSGYGVPVENMPDILQQLAHIFPIYHYMIIFRSILLKGVGLTAWWPHLLAGTIIGLVV
ncbi:MAG: ABC transporter permease, partial [Anaerolineae bacterium]|nr:ABC transporter permease [Anaerolineae bacterium]